VKYLAIIEAYQLIQLHHGDELKKVEQRSAEKNSVTPHIKDNGR
jgi:hypothetical protein